MEIGDQVVRETITAMERQFPSSTQPRRVGGTFLHVAISLTLSALLLLALAQAIETMAPRAAVP